MVKIETFPLRLTVSGFGGTAMNGVYAGTAFKLSGEMWEIVKENQLKNEGKNIWVYGDGNTVFAGVMLEDAKAGEKLGLETLQVTLDKYGYLKHVGPYSLIQQAGQSMRADLAKQGLVATLPYIEIYGHWNQDETKLETELIVAIA